MSSIYDWQKQFDAINRITSVWSSISKQMNAVNRCRDISSTLEIMRNQLNILSSVNIEPISTGVQVEQLEIYKLLQVVNSSKLCTIQDSVQKIIANYDFSAITSALKNFQKTDYSSVLVNASLALKMYDTSKFINEIQSVFDKLDLSNMIQVSDILEEITEQYIEDTKQDESISEEIRKVVEIKDGKLLTEQQKRIWEVYIYPFLVSLFFFVLSSKQSQVSITNNIIEVNNYYTVGIEIGTLNSCNFYIICKEKAISRIKPDCSSQVVEQLSSGKIVYVVDKYKKWIEIVWKNDKGEYCFGWIQNYNVKKFK